MARIAGVDLPPQKRLWVGLTSIYGIGQVRAKDISEKANVDFTKKIRDLTEDEVNRIRTVIEQEGRVEGDLRKEIQMNIRRLIEVQAYRGIRHRRGRVHGAARLPARNRSRARRASGNGFQLSVFSIK
jgi:small subunit ribosomal protein S13